MGKIFQSLQEQGSGLGSYRMMKLSIIRQVCSVKYLTTVPHHSQQGAAVSSEDLSGKCWTPT